MTKPELRLEAGKAYRTRNGCKARIVATDRAHKYFPVVALVSHDGGDSIETFTPAGKLYRDGDEGDLDLVASWIDLPSPCEGWRLLEGHEMVLPTDSFYGSIDPAWYDSVGLDKDLTVTEILKDYADIYVAFRRRITPLVQWDDMPAWAKWVAQDANSEWFWFKQKPEITAAMWTGGKSNGPIDRDYSPSFTGSWRDSLVERPVEGGK